MSEKRIDARTPLNFEVKLIHPSFGSVIVAMRDMSQTGIFVELGDLPVPAVGTQMQMQMQGVAKEAPVLNVEVARIEGSGVALRLCSVVSDYQADD